MTLYHRSRTGSAPDAHDPDALVAGAIAANDTVSSAPVPAPLSRPALRPLRPEDGAALHALVAACPPLDLNSVYAYLLLAHHHGATSVVADGGDRLLGAITAYVPPRQPDTLFVWQVAVAAEARGQGLAAHMLEHLRLQVMAPQALRWIETTITPGNAPSHRLFTSFGLRHDAGCSMTTLFGAAQFGDHGHDDELLYRIGPWATP